MAHPLQQAGPARARALELALPRPVQLCPLPARVRSDRRVRGRLLAGVRCPPRDVHHEPAHRVPRVLLPVLSAHRAFSNTRSNIVPAV